MGQINDYNFRKNAYSELNLRYPVVTFRHGESYHTNMNSCLGEIEFH